MELRLSLSGESLSGLASLPIAGVGLLRSEFLLRERCESICLPKAQEALGRYICEVAAEFSDRPVWYRLTDLWSDEAATLKGSAIEPREQNPILGLRGLRRGFKYPELLRIELSLIAELSRQHRNLHLLMPFVQDADEFARVSDLAAQLGHRNRIGSMLEIPAALVDASRFAAAGATNLLVGLNDLSCLMLGRERGSNDMKLHRAIWSLIERLTCELPSLCEWGIAGSLSKAVLERAEQAGAIYASVHYAEAAGLLSLPLELLPDVDHVKRVKGITRDAKRALDHQQLREE